MKNTTQLKDIQQLFYGYMWLTIVRGVSSEFAAVKVGHLHISGATARSVDSAA